MVAGALWVWTARRPDALFDVRLLADRRFLVATLAVMGQGVVIASVLLFLLRVIQEAGGASPLRAGLEMLPMTAMALVGALGVGRLVGRTHPAWLLGTSLLLLGGGTALMLRYDPGGAWLALLPGLVVAGLGWGATNPVAAHAALQAAPSDAAGMASGFNNTSRQIGIAVGVGALGSVFASRTASAVVVRLPAAAPATARRLAQAVAQSGLTQSRPGLSPQVQAQLAAATREGMTVGVHTVELIGALCAVSVGLVVFGIGLADRRAAAVAAAACDPEQEPACRAA